MQEKKKLHNTRSSCNLIVTDLRITRVVCSVESDARRDGQFSRGRSSLLSSVKPRKKKRIRFFDVLRSTRNMFSANTQYE